MELGLSTYSIAPHVKCDLARPWVRGALKKNLDTSLRGVDSAFLGCRVSFQKKIIKTGKH